MTEPLRSWHLPGLEASERGERWHDGVTAGGAAFRAPRLGEEEAAAVAATVREAALEARRDRGFRDVVRRLAEVAGGLADPRTPEGEEAAALLRRELAWPPALAEETLAGMAAGWSERALLDLVEAEVGGPAPLEGFAPDPSGAAGAPSRRRRAAGPPLLFQVLAGNVPGVAVTAILRGLLVRSGVLVKLPEDEPGLAALFARRLARRDPLLGRSLAAAWWPGGAPSPALGIWLARAGRIVVYGGDEAVAAVRARAPAGTGVVSYGPRIGVAIVLGEETGSAEEPAPAGVSGATPWEAETARRLAADICAYETLGCVSPRIVFVAPHRAAAFARELADALALEVERTGPPRPGPGEAAAIRSARAAAELRSFASEEDRGEVLGAGDLAWTVVRCTRPEIAVEALPRFVRILPVRDAGELAELLAPLEGRVQAIGWAGGDEASVAAVAEAAVELGASRVAPIGRLAWPPADWRHDGRHQLLPLLNWTDWEIG